MLGEQVIAKAYDNPIPGYKTNTVGNLRLWEALPQHEFDLSAFNEGKYDKVNLAELGISHQTFMYLDVVMYHR